MAIGLTMKCYDFAASSHEEEAWRNLCLLDVYTFLRESIGHNLISTVITPQMNV